MPLTPGDKLGPYEILSPLGAGGMGEVYRARDPKLNREVAIKVLDFGLAKFVERSTISGADSPTLSIRATEVGMSPEQAAGKPVDRRADIWSFGVVPYELLTGTSLFHG